MYAYLQTASTLQRDSNPTNWDRKPRTRDGAMNETYVVEVRDIYES